MGAAVVSAAGRARAALVPALSVPAVMTEAMAVTRTVRVRRLMALPALAAATAASAVVTQIVPQNGTARQHRLTGACRLSARLGCREHVGRERARGQGGGAELAPDADDLLGPLVAQVLPRPGGELVGLPLGPRPHLVTGRAQRAVRAEQAAGDQARDGRVPLGLAPAPAGPGELGREALPGHGVGDQRLQAGQAADG